MKRSILRNLALAATVTTVSVACGDESSGLDFGAAGGQAQGLVTGSATQLSTVSVGEGTGMSVVTNSLCVNSNTQAVRAIVDWGDVNDTADSVLTITPGADVVLDGNIVAAATAFTAGGGCAAGEFQVCGGNPDNCANIPHTYADDNDPDGPDGIPNNADDNRTTISVLYEQPAVDTTFSAPFLPGQGNSGQNTQARTIAVNNLPPTVPTANRSGVTNEGTNQTLQIQLADAGTRPGELVSATVSFGDADPTTINCTCAASGASDTLTCRNPSASNVVVATASPCTSPFTLDSFLLDNQNYQLRIEVLDEDGNPAAPVVRIVDVAMANVAPTPSIAIVNADTDTAGGTAPLAGLATSSTVSTVVGTPTTVLEGFEYRFTFSFTDPGTDLLNWSWNLAGRDTGGTNASPTPTSHLGRMVFSRSPTPGTTLSAGLAGTVPVPLLNNTQRVVSFNQGTPQTLNVIATDDDAAVANSAHFINVVDVDPRVTSFTSDKATAVEGEQVIFTVDAISGDFGSGLDVISTTGYVWEIEVDGTFVATNSPALAGRVSIADGCNGTGTTTDGGRTGTDTCTLTFLDADVGFTSNQYRVRVTVSDEDSNDIEVSSAVTVTNDIPAITKLNVTRGATTIGSLSSVPPLAGTINEADTISVTVGFDDDAAARDGTYTLAISYGQTTPTTDSATLAAPGDFTAQTETFADNKACGATGVCTITVTVCEAAPPATICDTETFALTVSNVAPTATATGPTGTLVEGATFTFDGSFTDPALAADELYQVEWTWTDGGNPQIVSATPSSTFANRNTSPDLAGIPFANIAAGAAVTVPLTLTVTDADGASDTDTINVTVRDSSPTVAIRTAELRNRFNTALTDARENAAVARITLDANPETGSDLLNTITVNWGDGTQTVLTGRAAPTLANEFLNTGVTGLVVVKDTPYTDNCTGTSCVGGAYPITVTVNDEDSATPSTPTGHVACAGAQPFTATCQRATLNVTNEVPVVIESTPANLGTIIVAEGQAATIVVVADDIASPDIIGASANMNFVFDWDSRVGPLQVDTTVDTVSGTQTARTNDFGTPPDSIEDGQVRVGRGAHIYSSPGQFPVTVTVTDKDGGNSTQLTFTVDVINVAPTLNDLFVTSPVNEGVATSALAVVDNRGADSLRYTFSTSLDTPACNPAGGVTDADFAGARPGTRTSAVFGTTFPDNAASRDICVRVCDDDGQANSCVFGSANLAVRNVDPVISAFTASATSINEGGTVTFTATATDVAADAVTRVIACGNNTNAVAATGVCTYAQSGAFAATVTFTEEDGGVASRSLPILVNNVAPTLTTPVAPAAIAAGANVTLNFAGTDPGGDNIYFLLSNGLSTPSVPTLPSGGTASLVLSGILTTTTFAVRACDEEGLCSNPQTVTVTVNNGAPVVSSLVAPSVVRRGQAFTLVATATDPNNQTLTYSFALQNLGGSAPAGVTNPVTPPGSGNAVTVTINEVGRITASVTVSDGLPGGTTTATTIIDVEDVPSRITAFTSNAASGRVNEGGSALLTASADNPSTATDVFTFTFDCDGNGTFETPDNDPAQAAGAATCTFLRSGAVLPGVRAIDANGNIDTRSIVIGVDNVAPVLSPPAAVTTSQGVAATLSLTATDPGSDPVNFELSNGTTTATVASGTALSQAIAGLAATTTLTVRACDNEGACSETQNAVITVTNVAPVVGSFLAPALVREGSAFSVAAVATDAGNDTLSYSFTFLTSGGAAPAGVTNPVQAGTPAGAAPSVALTIRQPGRITATVTVTDGRGGSTTSSTFIDVEDIPGRIVSFTSSATTVNEGGTAQLTVDGDDPSNVANALTFLFDCDGNGSFEAADTDTASDNGRATCTFPRSGAVLVAVQATDAGGNVDVASLPILVNNVAPTLGTIGSTNATEGAATTLTVTGSADVGGDAIRIEYDTNGDGAFDVVSDAVNGAAQVSFRDGNTTIRARACDVEGACSASATATVLVNNAAPVIQQVSAPSTAIAGAPVAVNVTATDPGNDALTYTFVIKRGDQLFQTIGPQSSPFFTSTFSDSGSYTVDITVTDTANAPATVATDTETIAFLITDLTTNLVASASPSVLNEGGTTTITVTPTNGVGPYIVSYDLNADGDFNDAGVDVADQSCNGTTTPCRVTTTYRQNRAGNIASRVLVSVTDTGNNDAVNTAIVAIEVRNVAPTLNAGADANVVEQALFTRNLAGAQTDPGVEDNFTFSLVSGPASMTISPAGAISWRPSYTDAGVNNVVVRVTDSDGAFGEDTFSLAVSIIDTNGNNVSDTQERERNNGDLLPPGAEDTDTDNDGVSDLDEVLDGTDPTESDAPRAPVVISPNGVTVDTATPTLVVANAFSPRGLDLTYTFVVLDGDGAEVVRIEDVEEGESTTSAAVPAAALSEQEKYTWFAFAKDGLRNLDDTADIEGESSDEGSFTVDAVNAAPGAPAPVSPANGSSFLEGTLVNLEARAVADADGDDVTYVFQVARDAAFTQIVATSEPRPVPFFALPTALDVGSYFWRATASDGLLTSAPGATGTFSIAATETNASPGEPTIVSPTNETLAATTAALTITAGTDADGDTLTYEFELADNAAFAGAEASGLQAGLVFNVTNLGEDTQYFWRARSFDGALYSDWVSATFVVDAQNGGPTGLAILSPSDGALLLTAPTAFSATEAADPEGDALTYTVVVSANADFSSPIVEAEAAVVDGTVRLAAPADLAGSLAAGSTYYWKVTATDGTSEVAAAASFSLYKAVEIPEPTPAPEGGCNCSADSTNDAMGVMVAALGLLGLRRRRRR